MQKKVKRREKMDYQSSSRSKSSSLSGVISLCAFLGAVALLAEFVFFLIKTFEANTSVNANIVLDIICRALLVVVAILFAIYYVFGYQNSAAGNLGMTTYIVLTGYGLMLFLKGFYAIVEASQAAGQEATKTVISMLPSITVPVIMTVLFALVLKNFILGNFSKVVYTMAFAFVLAVLPQEIMSALCNLMTTNADDKMPLITALLLPLGKALTYTAMTIFGVKAFYHRAKR